jgi:hypothetical protein
VVSVGYLPLTGGTLTGNLTVSAPTAAIKIQTSGSNNPVLAFYDTTGGGNGILTNGSNGSLGFFTTDTAGSYTGTLATWNTAALTINGDLYAYNLHSYASANPSVWLQASGNAANKKYWKLLHDTGGSFHIQSLNDSFAVQGQFSFQRGPQNPIFTGYNFNAGGNGPTLEAQSNDSSSYAPANLSLWRSGASGGAAPDNSAVGQVRFHGINNVGYTEWGGIHVDLVGNNTTAGAPARMSFWADIGNGTPQNFFTVDGYGQNVQFFKPLTGTSATFSGNVNIVNSFSAANGGFTIAGWANFNTNIASLLPAHGQGLSIGWNYSSGAGEVNYVNNYSSGGFHKFQAWNSGATALVPGPVDMGALTVRGNMSLSAASPILSLGDTGSGVNKHLANLSGTFTILRSDLGAYLFQLTDTLGTFYNDLQVNGVITTPTPLNTVNNTTVATTAYVTDAVTRVVGGATGSNATNKLSGSVAITSTGAYVNGPTTGSVGANGQKWMVTACAYFDQPTAGFDFMGAQVWNGSASVQTSTVTCDGGRNVCCTICTIVTLTGATTFTLRGTNFSAARGNLNGDSHITAVRLS